MPQRGNVYPEERVIGELWQNFETAYLKMQSNQLKLTLLQNFLIITLRERRLAPATTTHNNQLVRLG